MKLLDRAVDMGRLAGVEAGEDSSTSSSSSVSVAVSPGFGQGKEKGQPLDQ
jgi:hypothetical protein